MFPPTLFKKEENGLRISVHAQPGASKDAFAGIHDGALKLRISAQAQEGAANSAIIAFLAKTFGLSKSSIKIISGQSSRKKTIFLQGDVNLLEGKLLAILSNLSE